MRWYVVQAKDIDNARFNLKTEGYEIYAPTIEIRGKKGVRQANMFGSYLFAKFDVDNDDWEKIWYTRGVRRIMCMRGELPSKLPVGFVEGLMKKEEEGAFKIKDEAPILVGETVKILDGPLAGTEGICSFSTSKRIGVLLHLLGEETRVYLTNTSVARS